VASHYTPHTVGETPHYIHPPFVRPMTPFHMALAVRDEEMIEAHREVDVGEWRYFVLGVIAALILLAGVWL
jgi:hypothetical protein